MPDQSNPPPSTPANTPAKPADPAVYGGQWGEGDKVKSPGVPPLDSPPETPPPADEAGAAAAAAGANAS